MSTQNLTIASDAIQSSIIYLRGHKVMLSTDLAVMYNVEPKTLIQAVKRNKKRFPDDFMFQLTNQEVRSLKSQIVTLKNRRHPRAAPYAFTEQGIAMLSGVLHSDLAIAVNIEIMRAFVKLREMVGANKELATRLDDLEKKYDAQFRVVFDAIREIMTPSAPNKRPIGIRSGKE